MILAIDIGNSNINLGGYEGRKAVFVSRVRTDTSRTEFEYAVVFGNILSLYHLSPSQIDGVVLASVVPPLTPIVRDAMKLLCPSERTLVVGPGIKTGINIKIDSPGQLGSDLLATAIGAMEKYPLPAIIVDLGTATKLTAVDESRSFLGGSILPGVTISLEALSQRTAQLPQINLDDKNRVRPIGANTIDCMRSGILLGTASMIDGMVARYQEVLGGKATVIGCGGLMKAVHPYCTCPIILDELLLLDGLRILYEKNSR